MILFLMKSLRECNNITALTDGVYKSIVFLVHSLIDSSFVLPLTESPKGIEAYMASAFTCDI